MKLDWERPGVLLATLKVEEMATLVAGARLAAAALAAQSREQADDVERVLAGFDRALARLGPPAATSKPSPDNAGVPLRQGGPGGAGWCSRPDCGLGSAHATDVCTSSQSPSFG